MKVVNPVLFVLALGLVGSSGQLIAQTASAGLEGGVPLITGEAEEEEEKSTFEISGFVDAYYAWSSIDQALPTSFTESVNSFNLGMANVVFSKEGKVGFVADLAVGPRAEVANGFNGTTLAAIKQLYVTYSPSDWLTFTFGNYSTHVGYEVIDAPANVNYSTSYMFSNGPFYHTGLKADIALSDQFGLMLGVFDDTDSKLDFTPGKHFGAQLSYAGEALEVYLNYIGGQDQAESLIDPSIRGHQFDITATYQATEKLGFGLNATTKTNVIEEADNTTWSGAALYTNYAINDGFTLGGRAEFISDQDGLIMGALDGNVTSFTLSANFFEGPLTFIPEFRIDTSSDDVFLSGDGNAESSNALFILGLVYSFE
ncbi:MAG: porin [Bacteroidota bacterium]